jgi:hypothetical protein
MNYSQASIANLALGRIGARGTLVSLNDGTPNAVKVLAVWDAIFQEVLSERDWKFAKTRVQLQLSPVIPLYAYRHAWALPADLLRFVRPQQRPHGRHDSWWGWGPEGEGWYRREDPPFWPFDTPYKIETLTAGWASPLTDPPTPYTPPFPAGRYALTDYGGHRGPAAITYIQLITDYSQLMPGFVNCLTARLAMELAIPVTEDKQKKKDMQEDYREALNSAEAQNECLDFSQDEAGSTSWVDAGRCFTGWD